MCSTCVSCRTLKSVISIFVLLISFDLNSLFDSQIFKIEPRKPPPVGGREFLVLVMAPVLRFSWKVCIEIIKIARKMSNILAFLLGYRMVCVSSLTVALCTIFNNVILLNLNRFFFYVHECVTSNMLFKQEQQENHINPHSKNLMTCLVVELVICKRYYLTFCLK